MSRVEQYGPAHRDIDVDALVRLADAHATAFEQADREGRDMPEVATPTLGATA